MTRTEDKNAEALQDQEDQVQTAGAESEAPDAEVRTKAKESARTKVKSEKASLPEWLEAYAKRYPSAKVLHVTSDRQVFLDKDYHLAKLHQKNLGQGKIQSYNI